MNCNNYIEMINLQLDGELPQKDYAVLSEHLKKCESCRNYFEQLSAIKGQMAQMEEEVPESLHGNIMSRIPDVAPKKTPIYKSRYFGYAIAACILAVAVAGFLPQGAGMKKSAFDAESISRASDKADYNGDAAYGGLMDVCDQTDAEAPASSAPEASGDDLTLKQYIVAGKGSLPEALAEIEKVQSGSEWFIYPAEGEAESVLDLLKNAGFTETDESVLSFAAKEQLVQERDVIIVVMK